MTHLTFHHDANQLGPRSDFHLPVHLFGVVHASRSDLSRIGHPLLEKIQRLGVRIATVEMDFLVIALAVTAADTFVKRDATVDGWTRQLRLSIPLGNPSPWINVKSQLERTLHFLSGDIWDFEFLPNGFQAPSPFLRRDGYQLYKLRGLNCVSLFSGGLDSGIGAIDILTDGNKPMLISHSYRGDKLHQQGIISALEEVFEHGVFEQFSVNADPHITEELKNQTDISMRTRSLNFLAFAAIGAFAVAQVNQLETVRVIVPENGFISINAPLTPRRVGSLSTRTTHPHYLSSLQSIFHDVGLHIQLENPYQFQTKGEMVVGCKDRALLEKIFDITVSCSHWKRANQQCGCCLPCLVRRSALFHGGFTERLDYVYEDLKIAYATDSAKDDIFAIASAISQLHTRNRKTWVSSSGPLPGENLDQFVNIFRRGLDEIGMYLLEQNVL